MFLRFYGVRGSIPTPMRTEEYQEKIREILARVRPNDIATPEAVENFIAALPFHLRAMYGGNTPCLYLNLDGTHVVLDMGSGMKWLGTDLLTKEWGAKSDEMHVFVSHTHWDHIQGLPFFVPAYLEGNTIHIYSPTSQLRARLEMQQYAQYFPVELNEMGADIHYYQMETEKEYRIRNFSIRALTLNHPNNSYGYRIECGGKSVAYATDSEFNEQSLDFIKQCVTFFSKADVLVFDSQYTSKESFEKLHWGHSSATTAIDIAIKSEVKRLVFFHHEPNYPDKRLSEIFKEIIQYRNVVAKKLDIELITAYEGLEIKL